MSGEIEISGRCLCGSVSFKAQPDARHINACHCKMCRQWGGGPFIDVNCGTNVSFDGEEHIKLFSSSKWAERGFCNTCGTNLFYRFKETGMTAITAGLVDDLTGFDMQLQIFTDQRPHYYSFAEKTEEMTGQEVIEKWG